MHVADFPPIASLVPHGGAMCLLDTIQAADDMHVVCRAEIGAPADHALATDGELLAVNLCEYGAQAAAVHGALLAQGSPQPGYVAAFRGVKLRARTVQAGAIEVKATRLAGNTTGAQYQFDVIRVVDGGAREALASGRLTVALIASASEPAA